LQSLCTSSTRFFMDTWIRWYLQNKWFHGAVDSGTADKNLSQCKDKKKAVFLVRESAQQPGFTLVYCLRGNAPKKQYLDTLTNLRAEVLNWTTTFKSENRVTPTPCECGRRFSIYFSKKNPYTLDVTGDMEEPEPETETSSILLYPPKSQQRFISWWLKKLFWEVRLNKTRIDGNQSSFYFGSFCKQLFLEIRRMSSSSSLGSSGSSLALPFQSESILKGCTGLTHSTNCGSCLGLLSGGVWVGQ